MGKDYMLKSFMISVVCFMASLASESLTTITDVEKSKLNLMQLFFIVSFCVILLFKIINSVKNKIN